MERKIGKLGLSPVTALGFGHSGNPGSNAGPEFYLGNKLNLNVVYSVHHQPRAAEEIAKELGMTPVFLQDRIDFLEGIWTNNLYTDYEYLYEYMKGMLGEMPAADSATKSLQRIHTDLIHLY